MNQVNLQTHFEDSEDEEDLFPSIHPEQDEVKEDWKAEVSKIAYKINSNYSSNSKSQQRKQENFKEQGSLFL